MNSRVLRSTVVLALGVASLFHAQFALAEAQSAEQRSCINGIGESSRAAAVTRVKEFDKCYGMARSGLLDVGETVAECVEADTRKRIARATEEVYAAADCSSPLPSFGTVYGERANAIAARKFAELTEELFGTAYDNGVGSLTPESYACQKILVRAMKKMLSTRFQATTDCIALGLALGLGSGGITSQEGIADCIKTTLLSPDSRTANARTKLERQISSRCAIEDLDSIFPGSSCQGQSYSAYPGCVDDRVDCHVCQMLAKLGSVSESIDCDFADNGATDGSCPVLPDECPSTMKIVLKSRGIDGAPTRISVGHLGLDHNLDVPGGFPLTVVTNCEAETWPCGECTIDGLTGKQGRCENNAAIPCNEFDAVDTDDCGSENVCNVHFMPPRDALYSDLCIVERLTSDLTGTYHNETGDLQLHAEVQSDLSHTPCPSCIGDTIMNDGVRGGTCLMGPRDDLTCDASGNYPYKGTTSIECPMSAHFGSSRSRRDFTTGAVSLGAHLPCTQWGLENENCPCGVCLGDALIGCSSNADCGEDGPCGASTSDQATPTQPNMCDSVGCIDANAPGESLGACDNTYSGCNGYVDDENNPLIGQCYDNSDCVGFAPYCPNNSCGNCGDYLFGCMMDPIIATGSPDPLSPVLASVTCVAPSGNRNMNTDSGGLPGAERIILGVRLERD
jgi:hypothetical protein